MNKYNKLKTKAAIIKSQLVYAKIVYNVYRGK